MFTERQLVAHLQCLNEVRVAARKLEQNIDRCIRETDKLIREVAKRAGKSSARNRRR